jgi:hypothetical protein
LEAAPAARLQGKAVRRPSLRRAPARKVPLARARANRVSVPVEAPAKPLDPPPAPEKVSKVQKPADPAKPAEPSSADVALQGAAAVPAKPKAQAPTSADTSLDSLMERAVDPKKAKSQTQDADDPIFGL